MTTAVTTNRQTTMENGDRESAKMMKKPHKEELNSEQATKILDLQVVDDLKEF
jgi:hypothetical protein